MSKGQEAVLVITMGLVIVATIWIGALMAFGVHLRSCRYFVPVVGHPHVYTCSDNLRSVKP